MRTITKAGAASAALLLAVGLTGCDDTTGLDREARTVSVRMSQAAGTADASLAGLRASIGETTVSADNVPRDAVDAVNLTIVEVQVLPSTPDTAADEDGAWISLDVEGGTATVNLLDLPAGDGAGVTVASGQLEEGTYHNVRLFFEDAEIVLDDSVTIGGGPGGQGGRTVEAGTHDLFIPSGAQTGVKIPTAEFTVDADGAAVDVLVDTDASIQSINMTGTGLLMTPVLSAGTGQSP